MLYLERWVTVTRGGSRTCRRRGRRPNIFIYILKNPMKLKKFWSVGGAPPPKSATGHKKSNEGVPVSCKTVVSSANFKYDQI